MTNFFHFHPTARCESGWTMFKNDCYKFSLEAKDWDEAEKICVQDNGHLASILSNDEMVFISCLQDPAAVHKTWIGGKKNGNSFNWTDGKEFEFENWKVGQPNNQGGAEDCIEFNSDPGQSHHEKWNDAPCSNKRNYVCKKKPVGGTFLLNCTFCNLYTTA